MDRIGVEHINRLKTFELIFVDDAAAAEADDLHYESHQLRPHISPTINIIPEDKEGHEETNRPVSMLADHLTQQLARAPLYVLCDYESEIVLTQLTFMIIVT